MSVRSDRVSHWLIAGTLIIVVWVVLSVILALSVPKTVVRLGNGVFRTTLALTQEERAKGLSGTSSLDAGEAMMLVYDRDDKWRIWMKDMNYPLDIIWLDNDQKVVYIVKNAKPESYPEKNFGPKAPARYVLELPAGTVEDKGISYADEAKFDLSEQLGILD